MNTDALQKKIRQKKSPLVLRLDCETLEQKLSLSGASRPQTPQERADKLERTCLELLEGTADLVPAASVRSAAFCAQGVPGMMAMQRVLDRIRELGLYAILDGAYSAEGAAGEELARTVFSIADAVTVVGYLGFDSITVWEKAAAQQDGTVFLICRTPGRSASRFQDLLSGDRVVYTAMMDLGCDAATDRYGPSDWSRVGAVLSPYWSVDMDQLRRRYDRTFFLMAEYGGHYSGVDELAKAFSFMREGAAVMLPDRLGISRDNTTYSIDNARKTITRIRDNLNHTIAYR